MITISLAGLGMFLMKLAALLIIMIFSAMIILWPVNDKPISMMQKIVYAGFCIVTALVIFGAIQFTA